MEQEKDIKILAEKYAETKRIMNQLQKELKDVETKLKECGFEKIETKDFKITIYETAARKTFNLDKFKELNPKIKLDNPEYWKESAGSKAIKFTEIKQKEE